MKLKSWSHIPLLTCPSSAQYLFGFVLINTDSVCFTNAPPLKNLRSQGKNEQRNREENQQSLQKPSRTLLANKPFAGNPGINLTGYHSPRHPGAFAPKGMPSPRASEGIP